MLVITRKFGQGLLVGEAMLRVYRKGAGVRFVIDAGRDVVIRREELVEGEICDETTADHEQHPVVQDMP